MTDNIDPYIQNNTESGTHSPHAFHTDISTDPTEMSSQLSVAACESLVVPGLLKGQLSNLIGPKS